MRLVCEIQSLLHISMLCLLLLSAYLSDPQHVPAELYEKMSNKIYTPAPHVDTHDFDTKFQQGTSAAEYLVRYTTKIKNLGQDELEFETAMECENHCQDIFNMVQKFHKPQDANGSASVTIPTGFRVWPS